MKIPTIFFKFSSENELSINSNVISSYNTSFVKYDINSCYNSEDIPVGTKRFRGGENEPRSISGEKIKIVEDMQSDFMKVYELMLRELNMTDEEFRFIAHKAYRFFSEAQFRWLRLGITPFSSILLYPLPIVYEPPAGHTMDQEYEFRLLKLSNIYRCFDMIYSALLKYLHLMSHYDFLYVIQPLKNVSHFIKFRIVLSRMQQANHYTVRQKRLGDVMRGAPRPMRVFIPTVPPSPTLFQEVRRDGLKLVDNISDYGIYFEGPFVDDMETFVDEYHHICSSSCSQHNYLSNKCL